MNSSIFKGKFHKDHVTDGTKCWCKNRVEIVLDGEKVGTGEINQTGSLVMTINSDELAKRLHGNTIKNISITPQLKE